MTQKDRKPWSGSRTLWTRLEPLTRDPEMDRVLRAEVHDPAWMLCRQWQVGEFQGEDAGSPVDAEVSWARDEMSRFRLGDPEELGPDFGDDGEQDTIPELEVPDPETGSGGDEVPQLNAVLTKLDDHRSGQKRGSGDPRPAITAFEDYLKPGPGGNLSERRSTLQYLSASVLQHPTKEMTVTFFERANHYLGNQPSSAVTVGNDSIGDLVSDLKTFVTGGDWQAAAHTFETLVTGGTETTTLHLMEVVAFALDAVFEDQQSSGNGTGENGEDSDGENGTDDGGGVVRDYEGEPLEVLVEREAVATALDEDERPPARLRAEAGQQFLRFLADRGYGGDDAYTAGDFADPQQSDGGRFVLSEPDEPLAASDRRFAMLTAGRALDGHQIYRALVEEVDGIRSGNPSWSSAGSDLPLPEGESRSTAYEEGAKRYVQWYADLYDEPPGDEDDAWYPDRLEYRFQVSTGPKDDETVLTASEYPGGSLDWYSFSPRSGETLDPPADSNLTETGSKKFVPTRVRYPGMPVPRWWEFEDASVRLDDIPAGPEELSKLQLLDFSLVHSNDWFQVPLETPVGTLTRITDLTVTDNFGETTQLDAVDDENWNTFTIDVQPLIDDGDRGLFLPPTLGDSLESDPVERVYLSRDEMANLAFGVEELVESPVGDPLEREEFVEPTLQIDAIRTGADVDVESVELHNPGDAPLDVEGWEIQVVVGDGSPTTLHTFGEFEVPPEETVTVYTGPSPGGDVDVDLDVYAGESATLWGDQDGSVTVLGPGKPDEEDERFVTMETVFRPDESLPDYRLATSVPDHWYPLEPVRPKTGDEVDDDDRDTYRLALSLLLDADSMDDPLYRIPTPKGRLLDTPEPLRLYEEEVTRSGREVERHYQLARWTDGSTHLWSSRRASTGRGEAASRLRYDVLSEPDAE